MSQRTPPNSQQRNRLSPGIHREDSPVRPGQIYLSSFRQLAHQNQQLIECIKELKRKNEQVNIKIEEKLKQSRSHLEQQDTYMKRNDAHNKPSTYEKNMSLHNKFYRTSQSPNQQEQNESRAINRNISSKQQGSREKEADVKGDKSKESRIGAKEAKKTEDSKPQDNPNEVKKTESSKGKDNSTYRIIKLSHLKNIEELQKQTKQKSQRKTHKKIALFNKSEATPQKDIIPLKYLPNKPEVQPEQAQKAKKEQKVGNLDVAKEVKYEPVLQQNKKLSQLKPQPQPQLQSIKKVKDNKPYRTQLTRSQKYGSIYYTKGREGSDEKREKELQRYTTATTNKR